MTTPQQKSVREREKKSQDNSNFSHGSDRVQHVAHVSSQVKEPLVQSLQVMDTPELSTVQALLEPR